MQVLVQNAYALVLITHSVLVSLETVNYSIEFMFKLQSEVEDWFGEQLFGFISGLLAAIANLDAQSSLESLDAWSELGF